MVLLLPRAFLFLVFSLHVIDLSKLQYSFFSFLFPRVHASHGWRAPALYIGLSFFRCNFKNSENFNGTYRAKKAESLSYKLSIYLPLEVSLFQKLQTKQSNPSFTSLTLGKFLTCQLLLFFHGQTIVARFSNCFLKS